jgi:CBS-domain-containing membrane protein
MIREYLPLPVSMLQPGVTYQRPSQHLPERVTMDSPAVEVMTDLRQVTALTIEPDASLDEANARMIRNKVRLLLAVDNEQRVLGLITATDILGEKPMQFIQVHGGKYQDILVRNIMTPQERLEVLSLDDVLAAKVGHVVATLKKAGRQHAMVVEMANDGRQVVRGLFSASQVARQLGVPIQTTEVARTFAEIESMLSH